MGRARGLAVLVVVTVGLGGRPVQALEPTTERIEEVGALEHAIGKIKLKGSGKFSSHIQSLRGTVQVRRLLESPLFVFGEPRFALERRMPYDLLQWGGNVGVGWALDEATDVMLRYRLDSYKVFNVGSDADGAFQTVRGRTAVTALGALLQQDRRDDRWYPTRGSRLKLTGELGLEGLGGDYDLARLESDASFYWSPFRERPTGTLLDEVTFVEHLRLGWVESFDDTDAVPFFERYFVGGANTVRGHRSRWLSPRGQDDQFVGGEIQLFNNVEVRLPLFPERLDRQLSAALFFDAGRAFRRFSDVGDFGYGVGFGLRYVVHWWFIHGVARADYGFNFDDEGDDSSARLHLTFGLPF